jgi:hypothetical protein
MKKPAFLALSLLFLALLACGPIDFARDILGRLPTPTITPSSEEHSSSVWYVAIDGDDEDTCDAPAYACRTLNEVLVNRATDDDLIHIGPGTFSEDDDYGALYAVLDLDLSIEGAGMDDTTLESNGLVTVLQLSGDSRVTLRGLTLQNGGGNAPGNCLSVRGSASATVRDVRIRNCTTSGIEHLSGQPLHLINVLVEGGLPDPELGVGYGGEGITSGGNLIIENSRILNNAGPGLIVWGPFEMTDSTVEGNGTDGLILRAESTLTNVTVRNNAVDPTIGAWHAGVWIQGGATTIIESWIENNDEGIDVDAGAELVLRNSTIQGHPRTGLFIQNGGRVTLENSTVRDNGSIFAGTSVPGGIDNDGHLTIRRSRIEENRNGGIGSDGASAELFLYDSTVRANEGHLAGVYAFGTAHIEGSLITEDLNDGGAVENRGTMTIINSTISRNSGIGVNPVSDGGLTLRYVTIAENGTVGLNSHTGGDRIALIANSLIANNFGRGDCLFSSIAPSPTLEGVSFDSDGSCRFSPAAGLTDVGLGPLQDNGGPTLTHAIASNSPALDAARGPCPSVDQRGDMRPVGLNCDVGAYELGPFPLSGTAAPADLATVTPSPGASQPKVIEDTLCWKGPGSQYETVSSLLSGTEVEILGRGIEGGWWVIDNPRYPGVACWTPEDDLQVDPLYHVPEMLFEIPPLPTPTATPILGCLWYDQNQAEVCYPIDQCPVDFGDSLGACTP